MEELECEIPRAIISVWNHDRFCLQTKPTYVCRLIQDAPIILQPISTPMSGISANRRLPCGEMELTKQAMSCFFNLRNLSLDLQGRIDNLLPLAKECDLVKEGDRLNLS